MFTGIVATTGTLQTLAPTAGATRVVVHAPALQGRWQTGDSIAVNGVCLTAIPLADPALFAADLATETLERTTLGALRVGSVVNLELPTPAGSPLGGHVVQGHVDATATLDALVPLHADVATTDWRLTLTLPAALTGYVIAQGSITLDGISLTVARVAMPQIEIAIIPHTYRSTNLQTLQPGDRVNVETDVVARYAAQRVASSGSAKAEWLTPAYLQANGY